jgi:predicted esterase
MEVISRTPRIAVIVALSALTGTSAFAQSALERCRETVGRSIVAACMQQGEGSLEACRAKASPAVRRCMAANGGGTVRQTPESPTPDTGKGTLAILMPGAGGATESDFLVRNKGRIGGAGVSVVVTTSSGQAASLSQSASDQGRKVFLVGMSRGSIDVANALAAGAKANGVVLVSGAYDKVRASVGSPSRLPTTLVIHHRNDECHATPASAVAPFVAWSGGRASTQWIDNQGAAAPNPCGPRGAHGFFMQDGAAVSAINGFISSR